MKVFSKNKNILAYLYRITGIMFFVVLLFNSCDNNDIYDNIKDMATDETVYPAAFDTIFTTVGFERVEIDLRKDGRIPASQMNLSKAKKTVVVYNEDAPEPIVIEYDSVCSWVNVTGLTEPRLYRIKVLTVDEHGNRSKPQETTVVPYTTYDRDLLRGSILDPTTVTTPSSMVMEWPTGLNSIVMEYHGLSYEYVDNDDVVHSGTQNKNPRIFSRNLPVAQEVTYNMKYKVLPILDDGTKLLDTLEVEKPFIVQMPTLEQEFIPQELAILRANGINKFTIDNVKDITTLTYPMNMNTFADLFYFPNISTLNLTGKGLDKVLETLTVSRVGMTSIVGGGGWQEFMSPVDKPKDIKSPESLQTLKDLIESEQITKIQYIPKSLGFDFDAFLQPYVQSGVVELITKDHSLFPETVFIEPQFFEHGLAQTDPWDADVSYSGSFHPRPGLSNISRFSATNNVVNGQPVDLHLDQLIQEDGQNIYRVAAKSYRPTIIFALPREWRYDNQRYPYLKFKMFIGSDITTVSNIGGNRYDVFRKPWVRSMNRLWAHPNNSIYGQALWNGPTMSPMTDGEIQNSWREYTVDMSINDGGDNSDYRHRLFIINIGHEGAVTWKYDQDKRIVVYIADLRLTKTLND